MDGVGAYRTTDRSGMDRAAEGLVAGQTLGSYVHLHLGSCPQAAQHFVTACRRWRDKKEGKRIHS
jgi:cobyrinic acid a,c-diamide synthase